MIPGQLDLFNPPPMIERRAEIPRGMVFHFAGRPLRVYRVMGTQGGDVVIVEELASFGSTLAGQYGLWSVEAVTRILNRQEVAPWRK